MLMTVKEIIIWRNLKRVVLILLGLCSVSRHYETTYLCREGNIFAAATRDNCVILGGMADTESAVNGLLINAINCNSLNMSEYSKSMQTRKLYSILKNKADIVLLSDVRISSRNKTADIGGLRQTLEKNPYCAYNLILHSTQNKRGVGMMIKKSLCLSEINRTYDRDENYLAISLQDPAGKTFICCAVYGPNNRDDNFFDRLEQGLRTLGNFPMIIGGDWNCTFSDASVETNIDCLNMTNVPNAAHSRKIRLLCENLDLTDPFRILWPNTKKFSYFPRNVNQINRSRIDFFLMSSCLITKLSRCDINSMPNCKAFDHATILLDFRNAGTRNGGNRRIYNSILSDPDIDIVVKLTVLETHLTHCIIDDDSILWRGHNALEMVGRCRALLRSVGPTPTILPYEQINLEIINTRNGAIAEISDFLDTVDWERIQNADIECDQKTFIDVLVNNIVNEVSSYQSFIGKKKKEFKQSVQDRLIAALNSRNIDMDVIRDIEQQLVRLKEQEINFELEKYAIFDILTSEKITPSFLKLAKTGRSEASLSEVKNNNGEEFATESDRNKFISNYYRSVYSIPEERRGAQTISIEEFLGPEVLNNRLVREKKVPAHLANEFEQPLTLAELDKSVHQAKINSAGGLDGLNNKTIKKFWPLLRTPMKRLADESFGTGTLPESFKTAVIKLIPKKGDLSNIKNWRPISLLNCLYKVFSRAINNRLKKVSDSLTSRAQKGFTKERQIQETLANVISSIAKSNTDNIPMAVLAIDQAKAFDSIDHNYMAKVLEFFGFGERFRGMILTATTGRKACILLPDGTTTDRFDLERGNSQGDCPSPILFNLCNQILLFKIELDPGIVGAPVPFPECDWEEKRIPVTPDESADGYLTVRLPVRSVINPQPEDTFKLEANRETGRIDSFADDGTSCTNADSTSLGRMKTILRHFGEMSGLQCNLDKSNVMVTGTGGQVPAWLHDSGFKVSNEIELLGFKIRWDLGGLTDNFARAITKINQSINYWNRFRLSLPGRINITKTFLYSQIGYHGSILTPSPEQISVMTALISNYVTGTANIARSRVFAPTDMGGLGLFEVDDYITGIQSGWIKRILLSTRDNWRYDAACYASGNILTLSPADFDPRKEPVLQNIATSWQKFLYGFYSTGMNIEKSYILNNPVIKRSRDDTGFITKSFLVQRPPLDFKKFAKLRFCDITENNSIITLAEINERFELDMNLITYMRLGTAITHHIRYRYHNIVANGADPPISVESFLKSFKKGSNKFRKALAKPALEKNLMKNLASARKFVNLLDCNNRETDQLRKIAGGWSLNLLPNRTKDVLFQFTGNTIKINTRLSHFTNTNRGCTFCWCTKKLPVPEETMIHLFWNCPYTGELLRCLENDYMNNCLGCEENRKKFWLLGLKINILVDGMAVPVPMLGYIYRATFIYTLWDNHKIKRAPSWQTFKTDWEIEVKKIILASSKLRHELMTNNSPICRHWNGRQE